MKAAQGGVAMLVGALFAVGLGLSEMANPEKVLAFLNIAGDWDPSLIFVMAGAVGISLVGFRFFANRRPILAVSHSPPTTSGIDKPLIVGASVFGLGWGLAGYCPGPALVGVTSGSAEPIIFLIAMIIGSQVSRLLREKAG